MSRYLKQALNKILLHPGTLQIWYCKSKNSKSQPAARSDKFITKLPTNNKDTTLIFSRMQQFNTVKLFIQHGFYFLTELPLNAAPRTSQCSESDSQTAISHKPRSLFDLT